MCEVLKLFTNPLTDALLLGSSGSYTDTSACILCTTLVNTLEEYSQLNNKPLDQFIINDYCGLFDEGLQAICQTGIAFHGYSVIAALEKSTNPDQVCREIGVCGNSQCIDPTKLKL